MIKKFAAAALACFAFTTTSHAGFGFGETFATDPSDDGWRIFGDTNLFHWNPANTNLAVTWDSGDVNSYFYHPLGTVLNRDDNFSIMFDLLLKDIGPGPDPTKSFSFAISIGLFNYGQATQPGFLRGTGYSSPDLCEFAYFFDSGYGATDWPLIVDTNSTFNFNTSDDYALTTLNTNEWYHVLMQYAASNRTMTTTVTSASTNFTIVDPIAPSLGDFHVDTLSVSSFNDTDGYGSSVLAHGNVANIGVLLPPPPVTAFVGGNSNGLWSAQFISRTNWTYTLQRSGDLNAWNDAASTNGTGGMIQFQDDASGTIQFYRIKATR